MIKRFEEKGEGKQKFKDGMTQTADGGFQPLDTLRGIEYDREEENG